MTSKKEHSHVTEPYAREEDYTLKNMIGGDAGVEKVFSKENIARAQKVIDTARDEFFTSSLAQLTVVQAKASGDFITAKVIGEEQLLQLEEFISSLRQQAGALKFPFISTICKHVQGVCMAARGHASLNYAQLIRDMLGVLRIALQNRITDEESPIGKEVIANLQAVAARIAKRAS